MASDTELKLKGLVLSAAELQELTNWPDALIEDYLNIIRNLVTLATELDFKTDNTPTGSVPFVSQINDIDRRLTHLEKDYKTKNKINDIDRRITQLEKNYKSQNKVNDLGRRITHLEKDYKAQNKISEILRDIEDLKRSI